MRPTWKKLLFPVLLVMISLMPDMLVRQGVFGVLSYPLSFIYHGPPFVAWDKPTYLSPLGAFVTAVIWAVVIYFLICLAARRHNPNRATTEFLRA